MDVGQVKEKQTENEIQVDIKSCKYRNMGIHAVWSTAWQILTIIFLWSTIYYTLQTLQNGYDIMKEQIIITFLVNKSLKYLYSKMK